MSYDMSYDTGIAGDVKNFILDIHDRVKNRFDVYIGGGYLRDLDNDLIPKDLDVFFIPKMEDSGEQGYIPSRCYVNYNKRVTDMTNTSDMEERGVSQVIGLFNGKLSTPEIQFIVYSSFLTQEELARDFDMNINQINWSPVQGLYLTDEYTDAHTCEYIECLHKYDELRTFRRFERMEAKFPEYLLINKPSVSVLPTVEQVQIKKGTYKPPRAEGSFCGDTPAEGQ